MSSRVIVQGKWGFLLSLPLFGLCTRVSLENTSDAKERLQGTLSRLRCALQF